MTLLKRIFITVAASLSLFGSTSLLAAHLPIDDLESQRNIYVRAEHAFKKHDYVNFEKLSQKIPNYPLYPYLVYEDLKRKINTNHLVLANNDKILQFRKNYPDFPYHNALNTLWLTKLAKSKQWAKYIEYYQPNSNDELACNYHYAQYETTKDKAHLEKAEDLWLVGYSQSAACDRLFAAWAKAGGLSQKLIWKRFKLAIEAKNESLSKHLIKQMGPSEKLAAQQWLKLFKNPALALTDKFQSSLQAPDRIKAQIMAYGLQRLARTSPETTLKWWQSNQSKFKFSKFQKAAISRDIGVYLCHQRSSKANAWLASLDDASIDSVAKEWRIRLALAEQNWTKVITLIDALPDNLKEDKCWRYWQARAFEANANHQAATAIYQQLAQSRNYYGFLSSLRLKKSLSLQHRDAPIDPNIMYRVTQLNAVKRFEELNLLGREAVARVEWFRALDKMNEDEIIAAAKLAQQLNYHDIAIFTMARADFRDDVPLRFPLAHRHEIVDNADKHNLDPAWIFGIARQESAFFNEAISHAGARGLLQLLPSTAKPLAKKHDIDYESEYSLHEPEINIQLGTAYLEQLKKQMHNSTILATASYNAGPTRTLKWLWSEPLEADIWIETIPYKETREYVKNVLTFTGIYRHRLGHPPAFALMMKPIPAKRT